MSDRAIQSRLNIKSYLANSLFFLPAILFSISLGRTTSNDEFYQTFIFFAQFVALILVGFYTRFTVRRLHDSGHSGWFAWALIPPFTLFLLMFVFLAPSKEPNKWGKADERLIIFGIKARSWGIIGIVLIALFLAYVALLSATFLFSGGVSS